MRIIVIGLLVLVSLFVIIGPLVQRRKVLWQFVVVLLVPAAALGYFEWKYQQEITYISEQIVAPMTGNPDSRLECQRLTFAFVDVEPATRTLDTEKPNVGLKYPWCALILDYYRDTTVPKPAPTMEQAEAFELLATESLRVKGGINDEPSLRCLGTKNMGFITSVLGGTEKQGNVAAYNYQEEFFTNVEYKGKQCFNY